MWNVPSQARLDKIPRLYETETVPLKDKIIHLHFFIGGCDWYIAEYDGQDLFFGFAILNNDHYNSEWDCVSFNELKALKVGFLEVDCELEENWMPKKASEIPGIKTYQD
jgi:hypothetical protein